MGLGVQDALQQFLELLLVDRWLDGEDLVPDLTSLEEVDGEVVEVDLQDADPRLRQAIDQLPLEPRHFLGLFRLEGTDKEGDLVTETLLVEKAPTGDHGEEVRQSLRQRQAEGIGHQGIISWGTRKPAVVLGPY